VCSAVMRTGAVGGEKGGGRGKVEGAGLGDFGGQCVCEEVTLSLSS